MAKKVEKNGTGLGEISTIRDILMGQQINQFDAQLSELQHQIKESEIRMTKQMASIQGEFVSRLSHLEDSLQRYVRELDNKIDLSSDQERIRLGQLLADLSNQLLNRK